MNGHGFKFQPTEKEDWELGSGLASERFGSQTLMPLGHGWGAFVPPYERQHNGKLETMNCTVYASLNALETLANKLGLKRFPKNCSERFSGVLAGTSTDGNTPQQACEAIRKWGVIPDLLLPFSDSIKEWDEYYHPNPMDEDLIRVGQNSLKEFVIGHEYVFNGHVPIEGRQTRLIKALERGTVCVSVHAWKDKEGIYYKGAGDYDNHWTHLVDYVEGKYWIVRDTYAPHEKKLDWNYEFQTAKLYFLKPNTTGITPNQNDWFGWAIRLLERLFKTKTMPQETNKEKLYRVSKDYIGTDLTPDDKIPDEVACVAQLQEVHRRAFGHYIGTGAALYNTRALKNHLLTDERFEQIPWEETDFGDIVVFATGENKYNTSPDVRGHCFVVGKKDWMNNDSRTGLWEANYLKSGVERYWMKANGFPPFVFRVK